MDRKEYREAILKRCEEMNKIMEEIGKGNNPNHLSLVDCLRPYQDLYNLNMMEFQEKLFEDKIKDYLS